MYRCIELSLRILNAILSSPACAKMGTAMILSSWSTTNIENVARASGGGLRWFQLYVYRDKALTRDLICRAEREGYKAIVLTVDTPVLGRRMADTRNRFNLPSNLSLANFTDATVESSLVIKEHSSGLQQYTAKLIDPGLTWETVDWLRSITELPILLKGILTSEDALEAMKHDIQGIIVSNHGGRQLDGVPATVSVVVASPVFARFAGHVASIPHRLMSCLRWCRLWVGGWRCSWTEG